MCRVVWYLDVEFSWGFWYSPPKVSVTFSPSFYGFLSLIDVLFFGHHYFIFGKLVDLLHSLHLNFGVQKQTISISVFMVSIVNFYVIWGYLFNYLKCFTMIINIINGSATNCGPVHWRTLADVVHLRSGTASTHCYWQCQWRNWQQHYSYATIVVVRKYYMFATKKQQ